MCYSQNNTINNRIDEKQPLMGNKRRSMNSFTNNNTNNNMPPLQKNNPCWLLLPQQLLNRTCYIIALIGILWYCVLVSNGDYYKWSIPLFIAATICKLLNIKASPPRYSSSTNNNHQWNKNNNNDRGYYSSLNEGGGGGGGHHQQRRRRHRARIIIPTVYQRITNYFQSSTTIQKINYMYQSLSRRLTNDNHSNVTFLSVIFIIVPCIIYFCGKVIGHLSDSKKKGEGINHEKMANDFGKLGAAAFSFLLLPVSKHSPLLGVGGAFKLSEVHMIRLHITAGCLVLFGGIVHGLYYTYIWIERKGYNYDDVFPLMGNGEEEDCWSGLFHGYDKECHTKFVNLLGIISGISLLTLGISSLYWVRRKFYRLFYFIHIVISIIVLFGLVMHYNKMIWYMAPSLLYYMACNVPVHVESLYKWWKRRGVACSRVVCIPDSGGCVELSFRMNGEGRGVIMAEEEVEGEEETGVTTTNREGGGGIEECDALFQSFHDTIGKYIKLHVPEISTQSHPFTLFSNPNNPSNSIQVLFRPSGSFTKALSKRLRALTLLPEPTPSEVENHQNIMFQNGNNGILQSREKSCPTMLVNGIRCGTSNMFERVMVHDRVLIIAGGVGIVSYISLIHALRQQAMMMMIANAAADAASNNSMNGGDDGMTIINNHLRTMTLDSFHSADDLEGGFNEEENGNYNISAGDVNSSSHNTKRIDVHWMSRDEGLIRHVLQNYFEPFCHENGMSGNNSLLSINIVVHHTSPHASSSISDPSSILSSRSGNNNAGSSDGPTTWELHRQQQRNISMTSGETTNNSSHHHLFASPTSTYQGNKPSPSHNILPTLTYASIVFGGLWIVNYCYNNVQDKHVVETRPIAVIGIILLSMLASLVSNAIVTLGEFCSRKLFAYSKLENRVGSRENISSEIECAGQVVDPDNVQHEHEQEQEHVSRSEYDNGDGAHHNDDTNHEDGFSANQQHLNPESKPESLISNANGARGHHAAAIMSVSHSQGRPDLSAIVRDAIKKEEEDQMLVIDDDENNIMGNGGERGGGGRGGSIDAGIFMCGPMAMSDSVWKGIKQEEEKKGLCRGATSCDSNMVAVYQEVFEL